MCKTCKLKGIKKILQRKNLSEVKIGMIYQPVKKKKKHLQIVILEL